LAAVASFYYVGQFGYRCDFVDPLSSSLSATFVRDIGVLECSYYRIGVSDSGSRQGQSWIEDEPI